MPEHQVQHKGGFRFGMGLACGIIAAVCLIIALLIGGCLAVGSGCLAIGTATVAKVAEEAAKERKRREAEDADPTKWTDASTNSAQAGDVEVKVVSVSVAKVPLRSAGEDSVSAQPQLIVKLDILNSNTDRKLDYKGWAAEFAMHDLASLKDETGNIYKHVTFGISDVVGQQKGGESLYPGKTLTDVLVFEVPVESAGELRLKLPLDAMGQEGVIRLKIPAGMVQR